MLAVPVCSVAQARDFKYRAQQFERGVAEKPIEQREHSRFLVIKNTLAFLESISPTPIH